MGRASTILLAGASLLLASCESIASRAAVFGRIVEPLDVDLDDTATGAAGAAHGTASVKHVEYRGVTVEWDSNAYADIARRNGIRRLRYADIETLTVLGVWTSYTVHLYGDPE